MSSFKRRQSSDYNQSVPETDFIPESHMYQEKHFQPVLNQPVVETHSETEYGSTVTPDMIESRADKSPRSAVMESSDQPGEEDIKKEQYNQNLQGNSDSGTQYSTPDVSSGVSSGPGGFTTIEPGSLAAASTASAASTAVVTSTTIAGASSVAITAVGAVAVVATVILPLLIGVPSAIIFDEISVTDTTVYYSIYFEDYEDDMDLTVSLHNNFTDRSHKVESEYFSMMEKDLKPGMDYKLTVYGEMGTVLEERAVRTEESIWRPTSITFGEIYATDSSISCILEIEGYVEGKGLTVSLHNSSTTRTQDVESGSMSIYEEGLDPNTTYQLTIYDGKGRVLADTTVATLKIPTASFGAMHVTDSSVSCTIDFDGYVDGMDLTVSLHNSSFTSTYRVQSRSITVSETGLDPETDYYLTVYRYNGDVLNETTVKTLSPGGFVVSKAEYNETDGLIHLIATMNDPKGVWTDFNAVYYDDTGAELNSVSITDFSSEITMDPGVPSDKRVGGKFTVECNEESRHAVLFEKDLTVTGIPYLNLLGTPTITSGDLSLEFEILDPQSVRSDYEVHLTLTNASTGDYQTADASIINGTCTFTRLPNYKYWDMRITVTCTQSGAATQIFDQNYSNYDSPAVSLERGDLVLYKETTTGNYNLSFPIDLADKDGVWADLRVVLGNDYTATTTEKGASVVEHFTTERQFTIDVSFQGLYGQTLDLYICNGSDAPLCTITDITLGPTATIVPHPIKPVNAQTTQYAEFAVEVFDLVDQFNMVTDSSGNWRTDIETTLTSTTTTIAQPTLNASSTTKLGDGHYLVKFLSTNPVTEAETYRMSDTFDANGLSSSLEFLSYFNAEEPYTSRDSEGRVSVHNVFYGSRVVYSAKAVCGETIIDCTLDNSNPPYYIVDCVLDGLDPNSTEIRLYDGSGVLIAITDIFPYLTVVEGSAVYDSSTGWATVRFLSYYTDVNMPGMVSGSQYTCTPETDGFTLSFIIDNYSGGPYQFNFVASNNQMADYHWETEFEIQT